MKLVALVGFIALGISFCLSMFINIYQSIYYIMYIYTRFVEYVVIDYFVVNLKQILKCKMH